MIKPDKWHLGGKRGPLHFYLMGFGPDQMPLGDCIEGKSKTLLKGLSTPLMLFDKKIIVVELICLFLRIPMYQLQIIQLIKPGHSPGRYLDFKKYSYL